MSSKLALLTRDELSEAIRTDGVVKAAQKLGVATAALWKRCDELAITLPGRSRSLRQSTGNESRPMPVSAAPTDSAERPKPRVVRTEASAPPRKPSTREPSKQRDWPKKECKYCFDKIRLVKTENGWAPYELGVFKPHDCRDPVDRAGTRRIFNPKDDPFKK